MGIPSARFYFFRDGKELTDHPLNGMPAYGTGSVLDTSKQEVSKTGKPRMTVQGMSVRRCILGREQEVTCADFGGDPVEVKFWLPDEHPLNEHFLLVP